MLVLDWTVKVRPWLKGGVTPQAVKDKGLANMY